MPPSIVRRVDRGHVLLSDGWVARAPAPISPPLRPPRHSLQYNGLNNKAKQAVKKAAEKTSKAAAPKAPAPKQKAPKAKGAPRGAKR